MTSRSKVSASLVIHLKCNACAYSREEEISVYYEFGDTVDGAIRSAVFNFNKHHSCQDEEKYPNPPPKRFRHI